MNGVSENGWRIFAVASLLAVLGDGLLRSTPWGVNFPLWMLLFVLLILFLKKTNGIVWTGTGGWLFWFALVFSFIFAWRDSSPLLAFNFIAVSVAFAIASYRCRSGSIETMSLIETAAAGVMLVTNSIVGFLLLMIKNLHWKSIPTARHKEMAALFRGTLLAIPPLLLFSILFVSADAAFEGFANHAFQWFYNNLFSHLFLIGLLLWITGGMLRQLFLSREWKLPQSIGDLPVSIGSIETTVFLGLINLLFLSFVVIQIRYFFGGAALVETSTTITYSEYARRGFFELVTVSALVLPMLLGTHWLIRNKPQSSHRVFATLSGMLILLLFVIMVSALQRMRLYQEQYGLTELRFYTTVFMGWLAILFLWFVATVMRGRRDRFAIGAILTGMMVVLVLNFLNPDGIIVRANTARLTRTKPFDAVYAASLSADATPVLLEALPLLNGTDREIVAKSLMTRWGPVEKSDWRAWNWSRFHARRLVEKNRFLIQEMSALAPIQKVP